MITIEKILFLKRISIFRSLNTQELRVIADVVSEEELAVGEVLFSEGQSGSCMYFVVEGRIKIFTGVPPKIKGVVAVFEVGDFFGEMGLYDDKPRAASAMAVDVTRLLVLRKGDFCELISEYPDVALGIMKELNQRIRATNVKLKSIEGELFERSGNLYSRDNFIECMSAELLRSKKNDAPLSFVTASIRFHTDEIKSTTDVPVEATSSALSGSSPSPLDSAMREQFVSDVGRMLTMHQRPNDVSGRLRDDRLVVMLSEANREGANAFTRRVRKDVGDFLSAFQEKRGIKSEIIFALICFPEDSPEREGILLLLDK
ncbi:MAG: cyclic nucleotide-binding domain-containing protein [Candidatus Riflebacteria bacterium]|nr:cyclic nucleotide-binding domain-containing protein [Candidatus Riflebacteria bacterium]